MITKFEMALVISPELDAEKREKAVQRIARLAESTVVGMYHEGTDDWGKRRLAYAINGHREGYYHFLKFDLHEEVPNSSNGLRALDSLMREDKDVLRFLLVRGCTEGEE